MARTIFTIGFAGKTAEQFFSALSSAGVRTLVDIRLRPSGQLAGYARQQDLPYFLEHLADGCAYRHVPELAPTAEILDSYRQGKGKDWPAYVAAFARLLTERRIPDILDPDEFARSCLLCSEETADRCHRGLVAARMAAVWPDTEVRHL